MIFWIDAQISPAIAFWIKHNFAIDAVSLRDIGLRDAEDTDIFQAVKATRKNYRTEFGVVSRSK